MNAIFSHPSLNNDFKRELATATSREFAARAKAHPAFAWIAKNKAQDLLFKTLKQGTHFKATPSLKQGPALFTSPPPGGADQCLVIVIGQDDKGVLRACAGNTIPTPTKTDETVSPKFVAEFEALRSKAAQIKMLHQVVSSVATKEHMDSVERVYAEGQRYRCSPVFLIVLDGDKQHLYATTAVVEAPVQTDVSREWVGRVAT
jgi:hypothetical protein